MQVCREGPKTAARALHAWHAPPWILMRPRLNAPSSEAFPFSFLSGLLSRLLFQL